MLDVVVYVSSVANAKKHTRKIACLESFAEGVKQTGDTVFVQTDYVYKPARLAVMLGWATTNTGGPNIALRKQIIHEQTKLGAQTMCIDASCFKYLDNQGSYLRYSLGGPFYDKAEYANKNSDSTKWLEISQALGITLKSPVTRSGGHILICMQRDGGFAMKALNPMVWLREKLTQIRAITTQAIVIRPHPGAYNLAEFRWALQFSNVTIVDPLKTSLLENLNNAHSAVYFNSSASVAAACEGLPIFVDDESCVSWDVANKSLVNIEHPTQFDRLQWIYDLSAAHWSDEDGRAGRIYQKFIPFLR